MSVSICTGEQSEQGVLPIETHAPLDAAPNHSVHRPGMGLQRSPSTARSCGVGQINMSGFYGHLAATADREPARSEDVSRSCTARHAAPRAPRQPSTRVRRGVAGRGAVRRREAWIFAHLSADYVLRRAECSAPRNTLENEPLHADSAKSRFLLIFALLPEWFAHRELSYLIDTLWGRGKS